MSLDVSSSAVAETVSAALVKYAEKLARQSEKALDAAAACRLFPEYRRYFLKLQPSETPRPEEAVTTPIEQSLAPDEWVLCVIDVYYATYNSRRFLLQDVLSKTMVELGFTGVSDMRRFLARIKGEELAPLNMDDQEAEIRSAIVEAVEAFRHDRPHRLIPEGMTP